MRRRNDRHAGRRGISPHILRISLILSIVAFVIVFVFSTSASTANELMSVDKSETLNIPSNILPSYSATNFDSFDGQTNLSGWFFKTDDPISTVILVHDTGSNRMQFDVDTVDIIEDFLNNGYNVFLFDQRNSGESEGTISGYGYLEWQDVIGAISHVRNISVTTNVVLYGIGTGCSSCLIAYEKLADPDNYDEDVDSDIAALSFDRSYIVGMILDSPAKNSDDYIKPLVRSKSKVGWLTQYTVPYAIRVSAGESQNYNLSSIISSLQIPVCILYGDMDTYIGADEISQIVEERERLNPSTTTSKIFSDAGYTESYNSDEEEYRKIVIDFMTYHFQ